MTLNVIRQSDNLKRCTLVYPGLRSAPTLAFVESSGDGATISVQETATHGSELRMTGGGDANTPHVERYTVEAEL